MMNRIESDIGNSCAFNKSFPIELPVIPTNPPATVIFSGLMTAKPNSYMTRPSGAWAARQTFLDPWGHEFNFRIESSLEGEGGGVAQKRLKMLIWSDGPNGIDEGGRGDDLHASFGLELP